MKPVKNSDDLCEMLTECISELRTKKMDPRTSKAINDLSNTILRATRLKHQVQQAYLENGNGGGKKGKQAGVGGVEALKLVS